MASKKQRKGSSALGGKKKEAAGPSNSRELPPPPSPPRAVHPPALLALSAVAALCVALLSKLLPRLSEIQQDTMTTGRDFSHHKTRFCLNMIMKNEEDVLERLFDSISEEIAGWYVCDTGSTDDSVELTKTYFKQHRIPGTVEHHPWKDFSWNRNLCLKEGYQKMSGMCDYWIVFDADQQLVNESPKHLWELNFDADAIYIKERTHGVYFANLRIFNVQSGYLWEYRGALHESIYPIEEAVARLGRLLKLGEFPEGIFSIHDTVATRTLEEDVEMLLKDLADRPDDTRTHFYLAKAYNGIPGRSHDALYHYARRIQLDGEPIRNHQETFTSKLHLAMIVEQLYLNDQLTEDHSRILREHGIINGTISGVDDIAVLYEAASAVWSHRYEPYGQIAMLYWAQDNDAANCYKYASRGIRDGSMGDSRTNIFTTEKSLHGLYFAKCLCGFHSRRYEDLVSTCKYNVERLPLKSGSPEDWEITYKETSLTFLAQLEQLGITE